MEVKKITEGMTAPQVAQVIDDNFKAQNKILEEDIAKQNSVIGVSEYKDFSEAEAVNVGDVRKYNGFLYECVEATTGAFDASKWKKSSFKNETEKKLSELGSKVGKAKAVQTYNGGLLNDGSVDDSQIRVTTNFIYGSFKSSFNSSYEIKAVCLYDETGNFLSYHTSGFDRLFIDNSNLIRVTYGKKDDSPIFDMSELNLKIVYYDNKINVWDKGNISVVYGGLNSDGSINNINNTDVRITTSFIKDSFSYELSDGYLVVSACQYDILGNFIKYVTSANVESLCEDNDNKLIRLSIGKNDNSSFNIEAVNISIIQVNKNLDAAESAIDLYNFNKIVSKTLSENGNIPVSIGKGNVFYVKVDKSCVISTLSGKSQKIHVNPAEPGIYELYREDADVTAIRITGVTEDTTVEIRIKNIEDYVNPVINDQYVYKISSNDYISDGSFVYHRINLKEGKKYRVLINTGATPNGSVVAIYRGSSKKINLGSISSANNSYIINSTENYDYIVIEESNIGVDYNIVIYTDEYIKSANETIIQANNVLLVSRINSINNKSEVFTQQINDIISDLTAEGDKLNHVPNIAIKDNIAYIVYNTSKTEAKESYLSGCLRLRIINLLSPSVFTDINISKDRSNGMESIHIIDDTATRSGVIWVGVPYIIDNILYISANFVDYKNKQGFVAVRQYNIMSGVLSNWYIPRLRLNGVDTLFASYNLNSMLGATNNGVASSIGGDAYIADFTNFEEKDGYYYCSLCCSSDYFKAVVLRTQDFRTFEYVFTVEHDSFTAEMPIAIDGDYLYIAIRQSQTKESLCVQKYDLNTYKKVDEVYVKDAVNGLISKPYLFTDKWNNIYLIHSIYNRTYMEVVRLDKTNLKNSYTIMQYQGAMPINNACVVRVDDDYYISATRHQTNSNGDDSKILSSLSKFTLV